MTKPKNVRYCFDRRNIGVALGKYYDISVDERGFTVIKRLKPHLVELQISLNSIANVLRNQTYDDFGPPENEEERIRRWLSPGRRSFHP